MDRRRLGRAGLRESGLRRTRAGSASAARWIASALAGAAAVAAGAAAGTDAARARVEAAGLDRFDVVVLDAGHGGEDEGAVGPSGLREKSLVLDVTRRLARRLVEAGIHVVLTRRDDRFLSLEERTNVANDAHADLFLSIHANASTSRSPRGIEAYFASLEATDEAARRVAERENEALGATAPSADASDPVAAILGDLIENEHLQDSNEIAKLVEGQLSAAAGERSRGVKQAPFVVLLGVRMPATLVEIGFVTHPGEEGQLRRSERKDAIADALARAIVDFGRRYDARRGVPSRIGSRPAARAR
ncbi:MAG: N-acetylmuramoyl-L-alanine amidase [Myxococcota bacterium]